MTNKGQPSMGAGSFGGPPPAASNDPPLRVVLVDDQDEGDVLPLNGSWETDTRLCLEFNAPRPATIMGVVINMDTIA